MRHLNVPRDEHEWDYFSLEVDPREPFTAEDICDAIEETEEQEQLNPTIELEDWL